jgi:predicted DNA-binding transcriptional regulator AlpA
VVMTEVDRLLEASEVCKLLACSKVTLHRKMKQGDFPRPLRLDPANPRSRLRFRAAEIAEWIKERQAWTIAAESSTPQLGIRDGDAAARAIG